jgi:hypothetical protein
VQATINGAQAILKAFATNILLGGVVAGLVAVQIASIAKSKPPQFARGGKLSGASHAAGGVPLYSNGHQIAEAEGGEAIIKKSAMQSGRVYSVTGTVSQITSSLNKRYGGNSWDSDAALVPLFANGGRLPQVNYSRAASTLQKMVQFANGGVLTNATEQSAALSTTLQSLADTVNNLEARLAGGIYAVTSLQRFNSDTARLNALKRNVTMTG